MRVRIIEAEVAEWPEFQQGFYWAMVDAGNTPVMAHMLACRQAPVMGESDRAFCEARHRTMMSMPEHQRSDIVAAAQAAGVKTDGKFWVGGFGRCTDPRAWVSTVEDAKDFLKANPHLSSDGLVKQVGRKPECPPPKPGLAPDLADEMIAREVAADGRLKERVVGGKVRKEELTEMVTDKYGPKPKSPRKPSPGPFAKLDKKMQKIVEQVSKPKT